MGCHCHLIFSPDKGPPVVPALQVGGGGGGDPTETTQPLIKQFLWFREDILSGNSGRLQSSS